MVYEQGRIHGPLSRIRMGRGGDEIFKSSLLAELIPKPYINAREAVWSTDRPTDWGIDDGRFELLTAHRVSDSFYHRLRIGSYRHHEWLINIHLDLDRSIGDWRARFQSRLIPLINYQSRIPFFHRRGFFLFGLDEASLSSEFRGHGGQFLRPDDWQFQRFPEVEWIYRQRKWTR